MEKKNVPPTLFFSIIEGEKVQRVKDYPYPEAVGGREVVKEEKGREGRVGMGRSGELKRGGMEGGNLK